jgi:hypothetical protein
MMFRKVTVVKNKGRESWDLKAEKEDRYKGIFLMSDRI